MTMDENQSSSEKNINDHGALGAVEALFFLWGAPVRLQKIATLLKKDRADVEMMVATLADRYAQDPERGLQIVRGENEVTLATKPAHQALLETLAKEDLKEELTPASLETLSLIAYFGPLSRPQIDFIRGVNSTFIVRNLLVRGLVDRKPGRGNAYVYTVSIDFLKYMGVGSVEELPEYRRYRDIRENYLGQTDADLALQQEHAIVP
jgi:segregation and condensation protein B